MKVLKNIFGISLIIVSSLASFSCSDNQKVKELNFGFTGPLSTRATVLGIGPAKAIELVVDEYNANKKENEPKINFFIEDDKWEKDLALPLYTKLRKEHNIDIVFISNSDGTVAIQKNIIEDKVICVNQLNNDELLSKLNKNTFKIAKRTEETNGIIGHRITDLGLKKTVIFHFPNDFMTRGTNAVKKILDKENIECKIIKVPKDQVDFSIELEKCKDEGYDSYVFFGYKNFGFAMKQVRDLGITNKVFGSTVLLEQAYYDNSEGAIVDSEFPFFTTLDGNKILATDFFDKYIEKFGEKPGAEWPALQARDASKLVIDIIKEVNTNKPAEIHISDWLRSELLNTTYYKGACGNLSIGEDGASRGVYFSLYKYVSEMKVEKIK